LLLKLIQFLLILEEGELSPAYTLHGLVIRVLSAGHIQSELGIHHGKQQLALGNAVTQLDGEAADLATDAGIDRGAGTDNHVPAAGDG
jgi:hypothetical protein